MLRVPAWETLFRTRTNTRDHTRQFWGRLFIILGRIYSRALHAEGLDLRHSSGNICPNSCGLIRHRTLKTTPSRELWGGSNPLHTSSRLLNALICTCKALSLCVFSRPSACVMVFLLLLVACSCLSPSVCVCVFRDGLNSAFWWLNSYPAALCIGSPQIKGGKPWFHVAVICCVSSPSNWGSHRG